MRMRKTLFIAIVLSASVSFADESVPNTVNPSSGGESVTSAPSAGTVSRTGSSNIVVKIQNSCFATNLRSVSNPIAPDGLVTANLKLSAAGQAVDLAVVYPGEVVTNGGAQKPLSVNVKSGPSGTTAAVYGNTIQVQLPVTFQSSVTADGTISKTSEKVYVSSSSFSQEMVDCASKGAVYGTWGYSTWQPTYQCGAYMGQSGPLSASISPAVVSADNTSVQINVAFPGQTGFCGGYFSPLMVFWDEERPLFNGITEFPLSPTGKTAWPEKGSPGAFLALDRDHSGKIDRKDELFGDSEDFKNGFEALRPLDSNKDGWISASDKKFKNLILWFDKNGDGVSQKSEMVKASDVIEKISLSYSKGHLRPIGLMAEEREQSIVILKKDHKKVQIVDVWLSPVFNSTLSDSRNPASEKQPN